LELTHNPFYQRLQRHPGCVDIQAARLDARNGKQVFNNAGKPVAGCVDAIQKLLLIRWLQGNVLS
jgi:hypothetical protein